MLGEKKGGSQYLVIFQRFLDLENFYKCLTWVRSKRENFHGFFFLMKASLMAIVQIHNFYMIIFPGCQVFSSKPLLSINFKLTLPFFFYQFNYSFSSKTKKIN